MIKKKSIYKFLFRWMVVNVVFILVKMTVDHEESEMHGFFSNESLYYYFSAFFMFMITWEINDFLLRKVKKDAGQLDLEKSLKIIGINLSIVVPIYALIYYLAFFQLREIIGMDCEDPIKEFTTDFLRALLLGTMVIIFNMFHYSMNRQDELEKRMEDLKKEMLASKYTSLKSQISPHFLFNSLNTLTALMYQDRDLASDFVTRLASSYRYILDNREQDLVSLKKELDFLDSFVFMMKVRHKEAIVIKSDVKVAPENYVIPTLSLQMLVENAIKHNYYSKEKPLEISITTIENHSLAVKNSLRKRELTEETTKLGLKNIKKRYSFYTDEQVLVKEEKAFFEVIIPLLKKEITEMKLTTVS